MSGTSHAPLEGVRVVEFGSMTAAPFATAMLSTLGADVVKVEPLAGDPSRGYPSMHAPDEVAPAFLAGNAGKRSIALDLKAPAALDIALALVGRADVVVANLRPGSAARLGLDAEALQSEYPALIWVTVSGYGPEGPDAHRIAVDQVVQAEAGFMSVTGPEGALGYRVGFHAVDHATSHIIVGRVLAALLGRARTGKGTHIAQSLFSAAISLQSLAIAEYSISGVVPPRTGNASPLSAPNDAVRTKDGACLLVAPREDHWLHLCAAIGRTDLLERGCYAGRGGRVSHREQLQAELERTTINFTTDELIALLEPAGIMVGRIQDYEQLWSSAEVEANCHLVRAETSDGRSYLVVRPPYLSPDHTRPLRVPGLGEHTIEILDELGRAGELHELLAADVIYQADWPSPQPE